MAAQTTTLPETFTFAGIHAAIVRKVGRALGTAVAAEIVDVPREDEADDNAAFIIVTKTDGTVVANYCLRSPAYGGDWSLTKLDCLDTVEQTARWLGM